MKRGAECWSCKERKVAALGQDILKKTQYLFIIISNSVFITISYSDMDITETDINRSESDIPYSDTK